MGLFDKTWDPEEGAAVVGPGKITGPWKEEEDRIWHKLYTDRMLGNVPCLKK